MGTRAVHKFTYYIIFIINAFYRERQTKEKIIHVTVDPSHIVYNTQISYRFKLLYNNNNNIINRTTR